MRRCRKNIKCVFFLEICCKRDCGHLKKAKVKTGSGAQQLKLSKNFLIKTTKRNFDCYAY